MPIDIKIEFPEGDPRKKLPGIARGLQNRLESGLEIAALLVVRRAKQNLTDLQIVDRGFLRSSIDHRVVSRGGQVEAIVFAGAAHGIWVEFGRRGIVSDPTSGNPNAATAAFPPVGPIRDWVQRHRGSFSRSGSKGNPTAELDQAAYAIALKIYRYGIAPRPYLVPAFLALRGRAIEVVRREIAKGFPS